MGMDLSPRRNVEPLHLNWSGWRVLGNMLHIAGADTRLMSGTNDGEYITADVCRMWARKLRTAVYDKKLMTTDQNDAVKQGTKDAQPLNDAYLKWIEKICVFLDECGGCKQR